MEPLVRLTSVVAPLLRDDIDTDTIIPAAYMRSLATDPATGLFARWRLRDDGSENPAFVLNDPRYRTARILLTGANFGCGSSRENAVWALQSFGVRCVIALGFSDIFHENCFKNGVLPIALDPRDHEGLAGRVSGAAPYEVTVDVAGRQLTGAGGEVVAFELDPHKQAALLSGRDEIASTLEHFDRIGEFRARHRAHRRWLYGRDP
jgi:3-isopropylmalate/(R)-2-methylmalate dehydratase small subunit